MIFYENIIRNIGRTGRANMERITKKFSDGTFYCEDIEDVGIKGVNAPTFVGKAINKLAEYEDLEEQGLFLRLPCKLGDTVYFIYHDAVHHEEVKRFFQCNGGTNWGIVLWGMYPDLYFDQIGKSVFLTQEEAEQALAEMKGGSDAKTINENRT